MTVTSNWVTQYSKHTSFYLPSITEGTPTVRALCTTRERERDRERERERERETGRERETERETGRERETERERDAQTCNM